VPIHLKIQPKDLSPAILLSGDPGRTRMVAKNFLTSAKIINNFRGLLAYTGEFKNVPVSVVTTGMGCPSCAIVVEELVMLGAKILIRIGTCGGVQKKINPADLIIPDSAFPLVGLLKSYNLKLKNTQPDSQLTGALVARAKKFPLKMWVGPIYTSDAFYQEKKEAKEWESKGILAIEMECAGLFALARLRKVKAAAILTATGNILYPAPLLRISTRKVKILMQNYEVLGQRGGVYGQQVMETKKIKKSIKKMVEIALETVSSLPKNF